MGPAAHTIATECRTYVALPASNRREAPMANHSLDPSHSAPDDLARQAAAEYLHALLLRPGRRRRTWEQYAERTRPGQVNQLAVAEVLARYLWQDARRRGDGDLLPRQLKDADARALSGQMLGRATL